MDFKIIDGVLIGYRGSDAVVTVPGGVTTIRFTAFQHCSGIERVILPVGVKRIEKAAFRGCYNLKSISLPYGLEYIGALAFIYCENLKSISVPDSVTEIGSKAFGYRYLSDRVEDFTVYCSEGTTAQRYAEENGFAWKKLFSINEGSLWRYNGDCEDVMIPSGVTAISDNAFYAHKIIENVVLPEGVTEIKGGAFFHADALRALPFPKV